MEISANHYSFSTSNQTRPRQEAMDRVKTPSRVIERRSWILLRLTGGFHLMPQDADSMIQRCAAPVRTCALITLSTAPASLHFRAPSPFDVVDVLSEQLREAVPVPYPSHGSVRAAGPCPTPATVIEISSPLI